MITVGGTIVNASVFEILETLKLELSLRGIDLLDVIKPSFDNIMVTCPMHKGGHESKPSCGIHSKSGLVHCFTCGYSANLQTFIGNCLGDDSVRAFLVGEEWLKRNFMSLSVEERPQINLDIERSTLRKEQYSYVPEMVLEQYRHTHPYMYQRKLTDKVIKLFDIGFDKATDCITFPVRDVYGNCLFVARRAVESKWFHYPSGAHKTLYGVYENLHHNASNSVVVCESMFNALTCWVYGVPAIALNGTGSTSQLEDLCKLPERSLILCLDPDEAGRKGTERIKEYCKNKVLWGVKYKDGRDINDLNEWEFTQLMESKYLL